MTVSTTTTFTEYSITTGLPENLTFSYNFLALEESTVLVKFIFDSDSPSLEFIPGVHYSVTITTESVGGSVVLTEAASTALDAVEGVDPVGTLKIYRSTPLTQTDDWFNNGVLDLENIERSYDKLTLIDQEIKQDLDELAANPSEDFENRITALEASDTAQDSRLDSTEALDTVQNTRLDGLDSSVAASSAALAQLGDLNTALSEATSSASTATSQASAAASSAADALASENAAAASALAAAGVDEVTVTLGSPLDPGVTYPDLQDAVDFAVASHARKLTVNVPVGTFDQTGVTIDTGLMVEVYGVSRSILNFTSGFISCENKSYIKLDTLKITNAAVTFRTSSTGLLRLVDSVSTGSCLMLYDNSYCQIIGSNFTAPDQVVTVRSESMLNFRNGSIVTTGSSTQSGLYVEDRSSVLVGSVASSAFSVSFESPNTTVAVHIIARGGSEVTLMDYTSDPSTNSNINAVNGFEPGLDTLGNHRSIIVTS